MKSKRRIIATAVAVLISFAAALPAAAQETDSAPATGMEADVGSDTNGFSDDSVYPFVVEKLSQEDFERAAAEAKAAAAAKEAAKSLHPTNRRLRQQKLLKLKQRKLQSPVKKQHLRKKQAKCQSLR